MLLLSEKPPDEVKVSPAQRIRMQVIDVITNITTIITVPFVYQINAQEQEEQQRAASFSRMQALAVQRSQYHPNQSMGAKKVHNGTACYAVWEEFVCCLHEGVCGPSNVISVLCCCVVCVFAGGGHGTCR